MLFSEPVTKANVESVYAVPATADIDMMHGFMKEATHSPVTYVESADTELAQIKRTSSHARKSSREVTPLTLCLLLFVALI